ncbi:type I restriction enzyme S subunit [Microbacterium sp. AK009]|uniref:restriction endonuclease subunit S n=1 Tax=Microbacterium sp. AK009 TaxID=2723068 RepID=UPI0015C918DC|nr:restriction endonuclease subunit S [Microbacterium sp. AK009]NYF16014.1 type I restriction enzyme S subunit [Microbacterium sp. AK009]
MSRVYELIDKLAPNGVTYRAIGDITTRGKNIRWSDTGEQAFQYIDLSSVDRVTRKIGVTATVTVKDAPSRARQVVRQGDVIFATTRPAQMRWAVIPEELDGQIASTGFCVLRPETSVVLTNFLAHILGTDAFRRYIEANQVPGNYPAISDAAVRAYRIPVPHLEIQREIVRILDEFSSQDELLVTELRRELEIRQVQYAHYRDSLLIGSETDHERWAMVGELYDSSSGLSKSADEFGFGHPFLSFKTVFNNAVVPSELTDLVNSTEAEQARYSIKAGDVFVTRTSEDLDGLGTSCAALRDYPTATFNGFTKRLRPKTQRVIDAQFAAYFFRSSLFRTQIARMAILSTRVSLNDDILSRVRIPIHSIEEQEQIVATLGKLDALSTELSAGVRREIVGRRTQREYYRDRLLTFEELPS